MSPPRIVVRQRQAARHGPPKPPPSGCVAVNVGAGIVTLGDLSVRLAPAEMRILAVIATSAAAGLFTTRDSIAEHLAYDDPSGGCDWALTSIRVHVFKMKRLLECIGVEIIAQRGWGYSLLVRGDGGESLACAA